MVTRYAKPKPAAATAAAGGTGAIAAPGEIEVAVRLTSTAMRALPCAASVSVLVCVCVEEMCRAAFSAASASSAADTLCSTPCVMGKRAQVRTARTTSAWLIVTRSLIPAARSACDGVAGRRAPTVSGAGGSTALPRPHDAMSTGCNKRTTSPRRLIAPASRRMAPSTRTSTCGGRSAMIERPRSLTDSGPLCLIAEAQRRSNLARQPRVTTSRSARAPCAC